MHDRLSQQHISSWLQKYINTLTEEISLDLENFERNKKWLRKFVEIEGVNYAELENNLTVFFKLIADYKQTPTDTLKRNLSLQAEGCLVDKDILEKIISEIEVSLMMTFLPKTDEVIEKYESEGDFGNGSIRVFIRNGKYGLCSYNFGVYNQNLLISPIYDEIKRIANNVDLCIVKTNGKLGGYSISAKKIVIPISYDNIKVENVFITVTINKKHGIYYFEKFGIYNQILECIYDNILTGVQNSGYDDSYVYEGKVQLNGKWGYFNKNGVYLDCIYDKAGNFDKEGIAKVTYHGRCQRIYKDGDTLNWLQEIYIYKKQTMEIVVNVFLIISTIIGIIIAYYYFWTKDYSIVEKIFDTLILGGLSGWMISALAIVFPIEWILKKYFGKKEEKKKEKIKNLFQ
jgi:hypothetical protein